MIQLKDLSLDLGTHLIFENINCVFQNSDKVGIIGRNGAGKSTLLKVIAGKLKSSSGHVSIEKDTRIAYLPQEEVLLSNLNVFEEAFSAFESIFKSEKKILEIEQAIENGTVTQELLEEYSELCATSQSINKNDAIKQTHEILVGLGFNEKSIKKNVNELSTGWKMRLALAKLLLTQADIYLFDEPTNHLDIVTQQWFLDKLKSMRAGYLLVSHDQEYLEKACNSIFEIERGHGTFYKGNLKSYLVEKQSQLEIARATRARQDREIEQKQAIVDRFRASASRAQMAKNIQKQIDRIELVEVEPPMPTIRFSFPAPSKPGNVVLTFKNLSYGFNNHNIFKSVSGEIKRGERVALVAANGVGKTTLINCIAGVYKPLTGSIEFGHNVSIAFFEQEQARALNLEKTIFNEIYDSIPDSTESQVRALLGSFQFSGDDINKKIKVLSGGEKNRVAMVKILLRKANFLILDEPTNHLDLYSKDVLCQALLSYEGTIFFVSHDLNFVSRLATRILELTPTGAYSFPGTYQEYIDFKNKQIIQNGPNIAVSNLNSSLNANKNKLDSQVNSKSDNFSQISALKKQVHEFERNISKLESDESKVTQKLGQLSYGTLEYNQHLKKLVDIQKNLSKAQKDWEAALLELDNLN